jgi:hypothetical protein
MPYTIVRSGNILTVLVIEPKVDDLPRGLVVDDRDLVSDEVEGRDHRHDPEQERVSDVIERAIWTPLAHVNSSPQLLAGCQLPARSRQ